MSKLDEVQLQPIAGKKSKLTLLLVALLILMTLPAGFFGWRYFKGPAASLKAAAHEEGVDAEAPEAAEGEKGEGGTHGNQSAIVNFEPFLVNLADRDTVRYLRITIRLQVPSKAVAERIASTEVFASQMRDTILATLATKGSDEIITTAGKEQLKVEIAEKLNTFLPGKPVKTVFFTEFVVQL